MVASPVRLSAGAALRHKGGMQPRLTRILVVVLTILGLLMPRVSGVAASVVPGMVTVVICTGAGLQTLTIGEDGKPVPTSSRPDHCVLAHAVDTAVPAEAAPRAVPAVDAVVRPTGAQRRVEACRAARPPPRAPPAA